MNSESPSSKANLKSSDFKTNLETNLESSGSESDFETNSESSNSLTNSYEIFFQPRNSSFNLFRSYLRYNSISI